MNKGLIIPVVFVAFFAGLMIGIDMPKTFWSHPVITVKAEHYVSVGKKVIPNPILSDRDAKKFYENYSWGPNNPATIVNYGIETGSHGRPVVVYTIWVPGVSGGFSKTLEVIEDWIF